MHQDHQHHSSQSMIVERDILATHRNAASPEWMEAYAQYTILGDISVALVEYRTKHGLSQTQLAERLDVTQAMVSKYESGEYNISICALVHLCAALGLSLKVDIGQPWSLPENTAESSFAPAVPVNEIIG